MARKKRKKNSSATDVRFQSKKVYVKQETAIDAFSKLIVQCKHHNEKVRKEACRNIWKWTQKKQTWPEWTWRKGLEALFLILSNDEDVPAVRHTAARGLCGLWAQGYLPTDMERWSAYLKASLTTLHQDAREEAFLVVSCLGRLFRYHPDAQSVMQTLSLSISPSLQDEARRLYLNERSFSLSMATAWAWMGQDVPLADADVCILHRAQEAYEVEDWLALSILCSCLLRVSLSGAMETWVMSIFPLTMLSEPTPLDVMSFWCSQTGLDSAVSHVLAASRCAGSVDAAIRCLWKPATVDSVNALLSVLLLKHGKDTSVVEQYVSTHMDASHVPLLSVWAEQAPLDALWTEISVLFSRISVQDDAFGMLVDVLAPTSSPLLLPMLPKHMFTLGSKAPTQSMRLLRMANTIAALHPEHVLDDRWSTLFAFHHPTTKEWVLGPIWKLSLTHQVSALSLLHWMQPIPEKVLDAVLWSMWQIDMSGEDRTPLVATMVTAVNKGGRRADKASVLLTLMKHGDGPTSLHWISWIDTMIANDPTWFGSLLDVLETHHIFFSAPVLMHLLYQSRLDDWDPRRALVRCLPGLMDCPRMALHIPDGWMDALLAMALEASTDQRAKWFGVLERLFSTPSLGTRMASWWEQHASLLTRMYPSLIPYSDLVKA